MGRLKLFDDDGDCPDEDMSKIEINHEFAKRYEHNKKREELQRYEELKKQGRVDSTSSDSDEFTSDDEELMKLSKQRDSKFLDALIKVKKHDPVVRDQNVNLFDSDDEDSEDENEENKKKKKKKDKPMYLKNVVAKQLLEEGAEFDGDDVDFEDKTKVKSYSEEQEELRREFLKAVEEEENDDERDFLRLKNKNEVKEDSDDDDEIKCKLDEYFGEDEKLDNEDMFLKNYLRNRMWIEHEKSKNPVDDDDDDDDIAYSEEEEEIERQEDYEREYNFRYEENRGDRVLGHSRRIEGSVRKKDNTRKLQRVRKEERIAQAEFQRKEELKRLKNLKKREINERLERIREAAGVQKQELGAFLDEDDLEEEFDPEAYDQKMKAAFGNGYYDAEDADPQFGSENDEDNDLEKPDFDEEDDVLRRNPEGFLLAREQFLKKKGDAISENMDGDEDTVGKRKRKRQMSDVEKAVREQLMEEYYKLDYEGTIEDLKTRFKYRPVQARRFGLSPMDILTSDDKELNQYVSLKKIAPYREKEWKVPRIKTIQMKQKKMSEVKDSEEKKIENGREKTESNGDAGGLSRKSKRRQRQAEFKLSHARLLAYGKIASKSKSKKAVLRA